MSASPSEMVRERFLCLERRPFDDHLMKLSTTPTLNPRLHRNGFNTKWSMKDYELLVPGNRAVGSIGYSKTCLGLSPMSSATAWTVAPGGIEFGNHDYFGMPASSSNQTMTTEFRYEKVEV